VGPEIEGIAVSDVEIVNPNRYKFRIQNAHVSYVNTLRRLMMTGVKTVAFNADMKSGTTSDVTILVNDTPMTNEMLAHRIGLLPISVKKPVSFKPDEYTFTMRVKGDKDKYKDVTCSDFIIKRSMGEGKEPAIVDTETFFPPHPLTRRTCLIATLPPGETRLEFIAKASVGSGRKNVRYQPTSQCSYTYTLDKDVDRQQAHLVAWLRDAKKYTEIDRESERFKAYEREFKTLEINRVYKVNEKGEPNSFDFVVESVGPLTVPAILNNACEVGISMFGAFQNSHMEGFNAGENNYTIVPSMSRITGYDFLLGAQDHTFGNTCQTYLSENHMEDKVVKGSSTVPIRYVGYEVPHPLRDEMVLRIGCDKEEDARLAFSQACEGCSKIFQEFGLAFNRVEELRSETPIVIPPARGFVIDQEGIRNAVVSGATSAPEDAASPPESASGRPKPIRRKLVTQPASASASAPTLVGVPESKSPV